VIEDAITPPRPRRLSPEHRRALEILLQAQRGCPEATLLALRFDAETVAVLLRDGLAITEPETVRVGDQPIEVSHVRITEAGRQALEGQADSE